MDKIKQILESYLDLPYGSNAYLSELEHATTVDAHLHNLINRYEFTPKYNELDCQTFLETVLAKILTKIYSNSCQTLDAWLKTIRYQNGLATFINRHHFVLSDWLPGNANFLKNITLSISDKVSKVELKVNKLSWLQNQINKIYPESPAVHSKIVDSLEQNQINFFDCTEKAEYIELDPAIESFSKIQAKLPDLSLLLIVRPQDLTAQIGTSILISHMGIILKTGQEIVLYHASTDHKKIVKLPLLEYLKYCKTLSGVKGFMCCGVDSIDVWK